MVLLHEDLLRVGRLGPHFATLFGLATSLGLGTPQVAAGLAHLWGVPVTETTQVRLIASITGMALVSVVSGMEKGVKRLSEVNLLLALLLLAFVLTVGPTFDIVTGTATSLGQYLAALGPLSNWVGREDLDFMHGWTTFFLAWWIAWAPFVGLFIARVSRGRTVRELIACMLIIQTLVAALWMNAFGGTAVSQYVDGGYPDVIASVQAQQPEIALFALLETLPLALVHGSCLSLRRASSTGWSFCCGRRTILLMKSKVHPKYKTTYRVGNWREYERALVQRGDLTLWLSADATGAWRPSPSDRPGGQKRFSDVAIETALILRLVFGLPLRQTEGFVRSVLALMGADLDAPDHTTLSRRSQQLAVMLRRIPATDPIHLIVDSTGLSIVGQGAWAAVPRSRSYRQAGAGDRAAAMEEGDGLPSAGARGERLLPVQVDHRREPSRAEFSRAGV